MQIRQVCAQCVIGVRSRCIRAPEARGAVLALSIGSLCSPEVIAHRVGAVQLKVKLPVNLYADLLDALSGVLRSQPFDYASWTKPIDLIMQQMPLAICREQWFILPHGLSEWESISTIDKDRVAHAVSPWQVRLMVTVRVTARRRNTPRSAPRQRQWTRRDTSVRHPAVPMTRPAFPDEPAVVVGTEMRDRIMAVADR